MDPATVEPAAFEPVAIPRFFAARNAFFLIDPARVMEKFGEPALGSNLLHRFTVGIASEAVWSEGIAVPAFGVETGYYTVLVRSTATEQAMIPLTHIVYSTGFVLGTTTGDLLLCNADRLADWRPGHPPVLDRSASGHGRHPEEHGPLPLSGCERPVHVAPGWYAVTVVAGIRQAEEDGVTDQGGEEWFCAFLLEPRTEQPAFTADLQHSLNFFGT